MTAPVVNSSIKTDYDGITQLIIDVDNFRYGFTLDDIPPEKHEWLLRVLNRQINDIASRAHARGVHEVQSRIKDALGIKWVASE